MNVIDMPHCQMWWLDEVGHGSDIDMGNEHTCLRAPSFHLRHVCTCGAEMIEDAA